MNSISIPMPPRKLLTAFLVPAALAGFCVAFLGAVSLADAAETKPAPSAPPAVPAIQLPVAPAPVATPPVLIPQPDGPVPEGKVWSPEHGHWHDTPVITAMPQSGAPTITPTITQLPSLSTPGTLTPMPEGPVPPGKVWSPEHGHWHDAPADLGAAGAAAGLTPTLVPSGPAPQPEGPVPPGKVWSQEHGHWHDAAATAPVITVPPTVVSAPATPAAPAPAPAPPKTGKPKF